MIKRLIGLIKNPKEEWDKIIFENKQIKTIVFSYTVWLFVFEILCNLLHVLIKNKITYDNYIIAIIKSITGSFSGIFYILFASFILTSLSKPFNAEKNSKKSITIALYSYSFVIYSSLINFVPIKNIGYTSIILLSFLRYHGVKSVLKSKRLPLLYGIIPEVIIFVFCSVIILIGKYLQSKIVT
jgi:hypothetical protein